MSVPAPAVPLDIEFPLKTRSDDGTDADRAARTTNAAIERLTSVAFAPRAPVPFLVERLLGAAGPFGLEVELKSEERVVGSWSIEVNPRDAGGAYVSQAKANLYVCASARGDARATGAFLVIRQWSVQVSDPEQLDQLYESLSAAALERLDSLLAGAPEPGGEARSCALFLVDGRRLERKLLSLDRLQSRLLDDLDHERAIAGMELRVAHGRGTGARRHAVFAATLPAAMSAAMPAGDPGAAAPDARKSAEQRERGSLAGEVFVRETVAPANVRWNRRASDRALAIQRAPTAAAAPAAAPPAPAAEELPDGADAGLTR